MSLFSANISDESMRCSSITFLLLLISGHVIYHIIELVCYFFLIISVTWSAL